jgi:TRAP-type C4-dicarboxylate transport system substrate-binding protein
VTQHLWGGAMLLVSKAKFDKLSKADQKIVLEAGIAACQYSRKMGRNAEADHLEKAKKKGMIVDEKPDLASMQKATDSVYTTIYKENPDWEQTLKTIKAMDVK